MRLFAPPYVQLTRVEVQEDLWWRRAQLLQGSALVWRVRREIDPSVGHRVTTRPGGLSLIVILPPAADLIETPAIWTIVGKCRPHAVLPHHDDPSVEDLRRLLRKPPDNIGVAVTDYLAWRGIRLDPDTVRLVRRTLDLSKDITSVKVLARSLYLSRRALGRRFAARGLPVPSHWLQFGRQLLLASALHNSSDSLSSLACSLGFPDGFAASNQMYRLIGIRPSTVRSRLGWEWLVETWLRREADFGGFTPAGLDFGEREEFASRKGDAVARQRFVAAPT